MQKSKGELEISKLEKEIESIEQKLRLDRRAGLRTWITSAAVIVGILVSTFGVYETLIEVKAKNTQLTIEAQIRSTDIFLNGLLDKMSGTSTKYYDVMPDGTTKEVRRESHSKTTQYGAYAAATSLAVKFEHLCPAVKKVLTMKDPRNPRDIEYVESLLEQLKGVAGC